jgi:hypothetical protein
MLGTLYNAVDALFAIGQSLSVFLLFAGAYLALVEASGTDMPPISADRSYHARMNRYMENHTAASAFGCARPPSE